MKWTISYSAGLFLPLVFAFAVPRHAEGGMKPRGLPANPTGVHTIKTPSNFTIRYKEPGKAGVCETTPGVNSYSGYIDLNNNSHTFFWFFESRRDPKNDPVTLWLNGGPGSDSFYGLFQELGPCNITEELMSKVNPYSWSEYSNMLFVSQPIGTGFSYATEQTGIIDPNTGALLNTTVAGKANNGRYGVVDATILDTTDKAAVAVWEVIQTFYDGLGELDGEIKSSKFSLWTESYGGHYGPSFYHYFQNQNKKVQAKKLKGKVLNFDTLGIGNGIIDERIQAPYYPEFAIHNTYGIKAYNDTVYNYAKFAYYMINGCRDQIDYCRSVNQSLNSGLLDYYAICAEAENMCRDNVEGPYYEYSGRGVYDIRHPYADPTPPNHFIDYVNQAKVQEAIGVNLNYTASNTEIYYAFQQTGDFIYNEFIADLGAIIDTGVRVVLYYGDADYICNWFGGEAISLAVNFNHSKQFRAAGYEPFKVNGVEYGEVREYGNFSFVRIYEAGHQVPYYQPVASLEMFRRAISGLTMDTGTEKTAPNLGSKGEAHATHTEPFVPLPKTSTTAAPSKTSSAHKSSTKTTKSVKPSSTTEPKKRSFAEMAEAKKKRFHML